MSYVDIFGGSAVSPAEVSYQRLTINAVNTGATLQWPGYQGVGSSVVSKILELTSDQVGRTIRLPDATQVSVGESILIVGVGAFVIQVQESDGTSLLTLNPGDAKYVYLTDNGTTGGTWNILGFGAGTSFADASTLAGLGTQPVDGKISTAVPSQEIDATFAPAAADRCKVFVFTGGAQTLTLPSASVVGTQFFFGVRNNGTGTITVVRQGTDTVDGQTTLQMNPDESAYFFSTGNKWYTVGRGRASSFNFTQLIKNVAGGVNVNLTSAETQNKLITFTGALTANIQVIFPPTVNVYYLFNNTTGAFTLTVKTATGTGFILPQGQRIIVFCDTNDVFSAQTAVPGSAVLFSDGTQSAPSIAFANDTDLGFYRFGTNEMGIVSNNVLVARVNASGLLMTTPISFSNTTVRDQTAANLGVATELNLFNKVLTLQGGL